MKEFLLFPQKLTQIDSFYLNQNKIKYLKRNKIKSIKDENAYAITLKLLSHEFIVKDEKENYSFSLEMLKKWWLKKNL